MTSPAPPPPDLPIAVTAVIVLYRRLPSASEALTTLRKACSAARACGMLLRILLYDNTPGGQDPGALEADVEYLAAPANGGLAAAYNWAIERASEAGSEWLLTLDQDTSLPEDFLRKMGRIAVEAATTPVVAAIVPQIVGGGRILSPYRFMGGAVPSWFPPGFSGVPPSATFAFNSAALLRLSVLRQVGGYDPWFWLDNSDAFLFLQLHRYGKRVHVAGEVQVQHDFSMMDMRNRVSPARYRNMLLAESALWDLEMNAAAGCERTLRLIVRLAKHVRGNDPRELRRITQEFLKRRLFWSRRRRLQSWRAETHRMFPGLAPFRSGKAPYPRPRVSVCMAAYNGGPYIELQIRSILQQLGPTDELVIVDDASTDATVDAIRSMSSPVIRLIRHRQNQGVVATFEDALRNATGDILFLADGDDIWADSKVELFLEAFRLHPSVDIVTSPVKFIDRHGAPVEDDMYANRKTFQSGFWHNWLRNHFQGSAMAIRASLLGSVLPFPTRVAFLHDQWIGMRNARAGGSAICLEQPLLFYRRHPHNLSGKTSRGRQLRTRLQLLWSHLIAAIADRARI